MTPKVLLSYSWDDDAHKQWVEALATRLRGDGVETILDQWHLVPGTPLAQFMESAVRDNDFVIIICTSEYKGKADARLGGVGYESDLMTAERLVHQKREKFIPILRKGSWGDAVPTWLNGIAGFDLGGDPYSETTYNQMVAHLLGRRVGPPPVVAKASQHANAGALIPDSSAHGAQQNITNNGPVSNQVNVQSDVANLHFPIGIIGKK